MNPGHIDMRFAKPMDEELLHYAASNYSHIITVEDGTVVGGMGSGVLDFVSMNGYSAKVTVMGVPDKFIPHGTVAELHRMCGFDAEGIYQTIVKAFKNKDS